MSILGTVVASSWLQETEIDSGRVVIHQVGPDAPVIEFRWVTRGGDPHPTEDMHKAIHEAELADLVWGTYTNEGPGLSVFGVVLHKKRSVVKARIHEASRARIDKDGQEWPGV